MADAPHDSIKLVLIAGEPSGDVLGARLISALKDIYGDNVYITGIGGPLMQEAGLEDPFFDYTALNVMGVTEILPRLPSLLSRLGQTVKEVEKLDPAGVITIDSPEFSFRVHKRLQYRGRINARRIHYVAPTVWAWRPGRARKIARFLDHIICLYPFEPRYFEDVGLDASFAGHPLLESGLLDADTPLIREKYNIADSSHICGLMFGSRLSELQLTGPALVETARQLSADHHDLEFIVPTLLHLKSAVTELTAPFNAPVHVITKANEKWHSFAACDGALAVSGTVGLELAVMGVPHCIAYKAAPLTYQIVRRMVRVHHAHLGNIMMDKAIVPEFLQDDCAGHMIKPEMEKILYDDKARQAQKQGFARLRAMLSPGDAIAPSQAAAQSVQEVLGL